MKRHASMNRIYRLVWSQVSNTWIAVAENAKGRGKSVSGHKIVGVTLALLAPLAQAVPIGGQVVSGAGGISQSGATTTIQQASQNLSINWQSFNIAPQETVNFLQPSAAAIAVNRIFDTNGTQILGHLTANGQVWLINPNGILFGQGAQVNVGSLVASTLDLNDASLNGNVRSFSGIGTGSVINQGTINSATGGYVALLGNTVSNQGTISAQLGIVALGAGSAATLTFNGNSLVQMQVDQSTFNNLSDNGGLIRADGGTVLMSAGAKNELLASVVNNTGVIEARTVENHEGVITLLGGMAAGTVNVGGTLDASSTTGQAGRVVVTGEHVLIDNVAHIDATGATGGGEVYVGGGWQGKDASIANASAVVMQPTAMIDVSATDSGSGGTAVLWSQDHTNFAGKIAAKGGKDSGNGGSVETSSHNNLQALGTVTAANWLLDPSDVIISTGTTVGNTYANTFTPTQDSTILASSIVGALNSGNNVTITTGAGGSTGNITVSAPIAVTGGSAPTLTLQAANDINVNAAISSSNSRLNVILSADSDISGVGSVNFSAGGSITSHGGNVGIGTVSGGTIASMGQNVTMVGGSFIDVGMPGYNLSGNLGISVAGNITLAANSLKGLHNTYYYVGGYDFNGSWRTTSPSNYISLTSSGGAITTTNTNAATPDILTSTDVFLNAGTIGAPAAGQAIKISAPADFLGRISNPLYSTTSFPNVARTLNLTNTFGSSYVDEINQQLFSAINVTIGNQAATQNIQIKGDAFNTNTGTDHILLNTDGTTLPLASGAIKTGGIPGVNNGYPYDTSTDTIVFPTSVTLQAAANNITLADNAVNTGDAVSYFYYPGSNYHQNGMGTYAAIFSAATTGTILVPAVNLGVADITTASLTLSAHDIGTLANPLEISGGKDERGNSLTLTNTGGSTYIDSIDNSFTTISLTNYAAAAGVHSIHFINLGSVADYIDYTTDAAGIILPTIYPNGCGGARTTCGIDVSLEHRNLNLTANSGDMTFAANAVQTGGGNLTATVNGGGNMTLGNHAVDTGNSFFTGTASGGTLYLGDYAVANTYSASFTAQSIKELNAYSLTPQITANQVTLQGVNIGLVGQPVNVSGGTNLTVNNTGGSTYVDSVDDSFTTISLTNVETAGSHSIHFSGGDFIDYTTNGSAIILPTIATSGACAGRTDCGVRVSQGVRSINLTANSGGMLFDTGSVNTGGGSFFGQVSSGNMQVNHNAVLTGGGDFNGYIPSGNMTLDDTAVNTSGGSFYGYVSSGNMSLNNNAVLTGGGSFNGTVYSGNMSLGDHAVNTTNGSNTGGGSFYGYVSNGNIVAANAYDPTHPIPQITAGDVTLTNDTTAGTIGGGGNDIQIARAGTVDNSNTLTVNTYQGNVNVQELTHNHFKTINVTLNDPSPVLPQTIDIGLNGGVDVVNFSDSGTGSTNLITLNNTNLKLADYNRNWNLSAPYRAILIDSTANGSGYYNIYTTHNITTTAPVTTTGGDIYMSGGNDGTGINLGGNVVSNGGAITLYGYGAAGLNLNGDVLSNGGSITMYGAVGINLLKSVDINSSNSSGGGSINLYGQISSGGGSEHTLTVDSSSADNTGGQIQIQNNMGHAAGNYLSGLTVTAAGANPDGSQDGTIYFQGTSYLLNGSFSSTGNTQLWNGGAQTIDTEQGNLAGAGNITFSGYGLQTSPYAPLVLDASTGANGFNGGNVDLYGDYNHSALSAASLTINTTGGTGGTSGSINLPAVSTTTNGQLNTQSYTGGIITLNGNLTTDKGDITLTGDTRLAASVILSTWVNDTNVQNGTAGTVTIGGTGISATSTGYDLTINTGTDTGSDFYNGDQNFTHNAGNVSIVAGNAGSPYVNNLVVNTSTAGDHNTGVTNGAIALNTVGTEGSQTYTGGATTVSGSLTSNGGNIDLSGVSSVALSGAQVTIATDRASGNNAAGVLNLGTNALNGSTALSIDTTADGGGAGTDLTLTNIGNTTPLSSINVKAKALTVGAGGVTASGNITLEARGALSDLTLNAPVTSTSGNIVLVAGQNFINTLSANTGIMPGSGRYVVYSTNPANSTEEMTGYSKHYNQTYSAGSTPTYASAGNWFLYSIAPTITVTSGISPITYGAADPTLTPGYSGLIDGDTPASLTGTPTLTLATYTASGAHLRPVGNYSITLIGALSNDLGYQYAAFSDSLTVTPKDLNVTGLTANNKVYNANATAILGGSAAVTALGSDVVTLGGTAVGTFASKDVGTRAVTVTGNTISGADALNYNLIQQNGLSANITKADLTVSGITAAGKVYNANQTAVLGGSAAVTALGSDVVTLGGTAVGTFASKDVGTQAVTVTGNTISGGADAGNYNLVQQSGLSADITKADLNVTGLTASDKVYNANQTAVLGGSAAVTKLGADDVTLGGSAVGTFASKDVGNRAVTVTGNTISGADIGNYTLVQQTGLSADITNADLNVTGLTASDKVYNGNITAILGGAASITALGNDDVTLGGSASGTFALKDVGNRAVTVTGNTLRGGDIGNYTLVQQTGLTADITKADLNVTGLTASDKVYNGNITAILGGAASITALGNDDVTVGGSASGTFVLKDVGIRAVTVSGNTISGADIGNYTLVQQTGLSANITPAQLTVTANAASRVYGAANPALSGSVSGFVNGELLANVTTGTETFTSTASATTNVGSYGITGAGLTANNGNYLFSQAAGNASALTITPALTVSPGTPLKSVENVTALLQSTILSPQVSTKPEEISLSPTLMVTESSSSDTAAAGDASSSDSDNSSPDEPHWRVAIAGGDSSSSGSGNGTVVNTMMNIGGGMGPTLQIVNGGMKLPDNHSQDEMRKTP